VPPCRGCLKTPRWAPIVPRWTVGVGFIPALFPRPREAGGDKPRPYIDFPRAEPMRHEVLSALRSVWDVRGMPRFHATFDI